MEVAFSGHVPILDASSVGDARRTALLMAQRLGFSEKRAGDLALLTTEVSRNVLLHGQGGQIVFSGMRSAEGPVARVLALDKGPGIPNIAEAMRDGFSTAGTMGAGMGAMKRMADNLEIFTGKNGTMVLLEVGDVSRDRDFQVAGMTLPYPGERACGDEWAMHRSEDRLLVMLVDGLGHGPEAAEAAQLAVTAFHRRADLSAGAILGHVHDSLKKTRGAVGAIAEIRPRGRVLNYCGVGNISASILSNGASRSMMSHNGTLGVVTSRIQEFQFEWTPGSTLILHSDGLQTRWDLSAYPGLLNRHAGLIGGAVLRDFRRTRDDAGVVVVKAAA